MLNFEITDVNNLLSKNIKVDLPIKKVSTIVKKGIESNLRSGKSYDGSAVPALKASTIKRKGHSRVFYDTGQLFGSVQDIFVSELERHVKIGKERSLIASYLIEGKDPLAGPREFFGINSDFESKIEKELQKAKLKYE